MIESPKSSVWISAATIWEIAIKHSLGRGDIPVSSQDALRYFRESGSASCLSSPSTRQPSKTWRRT